MNSPLMRVVDAANYLQVSRATFWRRLKEGAFPCVRIGGRTLFRRSDLDDFIERQVQAGNAVH